MSDCLSWSLAEWEESEQKALSGIKHLIKEVPDFPQKGINFRDVMPVFLNPNATKVMVDIFERYIKKNYSSVEGIVGLESRGFMIGTMVALRLHIPFIPIRKQGKLPGKCISTKSTKEYGSDIIEMQENALRSVNKVILIDDLLATGGTLKNSCELVAKCGGDILCCMTLSEIMELRGREGMEYPFHSFLQYFPRGQKKMPEGHLIEYDSCPICLERITDKCYLPCNHMFCKKCIIKVHLMIENCVCPVCRCPTKLTEIKSIETNTALFRLNNLRICGSVYVQGNEVGLASYHFDSETDCYISFASPCCLLCPSLDNGDRPPVRKPFVNFKIDEENRIFTGEIHWVPASWQGNVCWVYRMQFSDDYEEIVSGTLVKYDSISRRNILGIVEFGFKLRYRRLHSNDLKKLLSSEFPSLYEVL